MFYRSEDLLEFFVGALLSVTVGIAICLYVAPAAFVLADVILAVALAARIRHTAQ